jgi:hypothetical protein
MSYRDTVDGGWDAQIVAPEGSPASGWMADLWIEPAADGDTPSRFSFHKPTLELALLILEKLSHVSGPFLLMDGASGRAVVVSSGADVPKLVAELWGSAADR